MVLSIHLPSGQRVACPASAARLSSADDSLSVEHAASGDVLYASAERAELTVGRGSDVRHFRLHLMNARLAPTEWSFLAADVAELPASPAEAVEMEQAVFPMI